MTFSSFLDDSTAFGFQFFSFFGGETVTVEEERGGD
jgi:hypothetical protein